jgi:hypothetical protein
LLLSTDGSNDTVLDDVFEAILCSATGFCVRFILQMASLNGQFTLLHGAFQAREFCVEAPDVARLCKSDTSMTHQMQSE